MYYVMARCVWDYDSLWVEPGAWSFGAGVPLIAWHSTKDQMVNRAFLVEEIRDSLTAAASEDRLLSAGELGSG